MDSEAQSGKAAAAKVAQTRLSVGEVRIFVIFGAREAEGEEVVVHVYS